MKKLLLLAMLLAISLAAPALAQEGTTEEEPSDDPPPAREGTTGEEPPAEEASTEEDPAADEPPGPPPGEPTATLTFELAVEGEPPEDTTFFGNLQTGEGGPGTFVPLADPDGDGLYTGTTTTPKFGPGPRPVPPGVEPLSFGVRIVQGTGTQGNLPGEPSTVIKDFGAVPMNDQTLSAGVDFPEGGDPDDTVPATFELAIEGEVPEGRLFDVILVSGDIIFEKIELCSTSDAVGTDLPGCEDSETYSGTAEVPAGGSVDFSYSWAQFDESGGPITAETFYSDTRTFDEAETVRATYQADGPGDDITATGTLEKPGITTYQYGSHAVTDETTGTLYALRSSTVNLDDYVGERVTLSGALVPGYEDGQIEGGPPLVEVTDVEPADGGEFATVTFELTVEEGTPPEDATFFGYLGYEPAPFQLTDPDGDGVYTGSTPPELVPAGDTQPAGIVQGTGTRRDQAVGTSPGEPASVLEDFGEVTFEEDTTLRASVSFETGGGPLGGVTDGITGLLPSTGGGMALTVLGAGILLVGGGLMVRRIFR